MIKFLKSFLIKISIMGEFIGFLRKRKLWWLIPVIIILIILGLLILLSQQTALVPFIYPLF